MNKQYVGVLIKLSTHDHLALYFEKTENFSKILSNSLLITNFKCMFYFYYMTMEM